MKKIISVFGIVCFVFGFLNFAPSFFLEGFCCVMIMKFRDRRVMPFLIAALTGIVPPGNEKEGTFVGLRIFSLIIPFMIQTFLVGEFLGIVFAVLYFFAVPATFVLAFRLFRPFGKLERLSQPAVRV